MDEQRARLFFRQRLLLDGMPAKDAILEMIDDRIRDAAKRFLADDYGRRASPSGSASGSASSLRPRLQREHLRGRCRGGVHRVEGQLGDAVREAMEESLPSDGDPGDWT